MIILKSGLFADEERKELEPLGQEVLPTEPPLEPSEAPPTVSLNTANDPQWQCEIGKGFWGEFSGNAVSLSEEIII